MLNVKARAPGLLRTSLSVGMALFLSLAMGCSEGGGLDVGSSDPAALNGSEKPRPGADPGAGAGQGTSAPSTGTSATGTPAPTTGTAAPSTGTSAPSTGGTVAATTGKPLPPMGGASDAGAADTGTAPGNPDPGTTKPMTPPPPVTVPPGPVSSGMVCNVNTKCPSGEYCELKDGECLVAGATGTCRLIPNAITENIHPVCGCDGRTYGNHSQAHAWGVSVQADGACPKGAPAPMQRARQ
ncbi:MAG TPA: hypothetical protein VGF45_00150 [Polyangia bacterium]